MEALQAAVTVLTAMITPAVLISSCAGLILSTSARLGRVADRVRVLSEKLEEISHNENKPEHHRERLKTMFVQLDKLTSRARILQRSIVVFYTALGLVRGDEHRHRDRRRLRLRLFLSANRRGLCWRVSAFLRQHHAHL